MEIEALRGLGTCPRSHSNAGVDQIEESNEKQKDTKRFGPSFTGAHIIITISF